MVTIYPNPPPVQDLYGYNPMVIRTGGPGLDHEANGNFINGSVNSGSEDPSKKIRKPYTITKSRENWTELEHDKFLEALQLFDRDWKKIEAFVGSKTVIQIRSHAQKYFQKIQKNGANEHVPPPRPKRKASHPYPHKALKNVPIQSSTTLVEPEPIIWSDSLFVPESSLNPFWSSWDNNTVSGVNIPRVTKGITPDFAQVYSFISTVFDPNASDHLQTLRNMDPINVETVLMLMKNLSTNLINPEFEDHVKLLSSENAGIDIDKMSLKAIEASIKQE